ncbi:hypothetical protein M050_gp77 [Streptomyces phage Sujidade]|uniref:Uncharacterized protein n=1 Tax=Streptomyces phage Sujidade TaxID=1327759 RepID=R4TB20_9CAUD|nr:hypothetical protein M050_gp77 [Streptomyces phage Sujidade]AGM12175.1 hypothetical protein SUJIDADE_77 [Streptomyces phage Sujidade]
MQVPLLSSQGPTASFEATSLATLRASPLGAVPFCVAFTLPDSLGGVNSSLCPGVLGCASCDCGRLLPDVVVHEPATLSTPVTRPCRLLALPR